MILKPFVKWPGGKSSEINILKTHFPENFNNYFEPFLGGGAILFYVLPRVKKAFANDISRDLILLNKTIKKQDSEFFENLKYFNVAWESISLFIEEEKTLIIDALKELSKKSNMNNQLFESIVVLFANLNIKLGDSELKKFAKSISRKLKRISVIERNNSFVFSEESILDNFETLIKAEYYYFIRNKYNKEKLSNSMRAAYFYFIREYCYSSMFRFNKFGEFNVPYGGLNYNKKDFSKKIEYLKSFEFISNYKKVAFFKSDFEVFLNRFIFSSDDFVFLDPPYDSDFSDYDKSSFSKKDHERLRDWMLNTKAKVMLVIKNTDFIYKLYSNRKFSIHDFSKNYTVSFKNRNEKKAVHLIIKNY